MIQQELWFVSMSFWCVLQMFRMRHQQQAAAGSFLNSDLLPHVSSSAQQLAVRLTATKDADAQTVGVALL
jgi:hypothetical protein